MARNHFDPDYRPAAHRGRKLWGKGTLTSKAGLVGISSAAILSVYAAGYFNTSASESNVELAAALATPAAQATATVGIQPGTSSAAPTVAPGGSTQRAAPTKPAATSTPVPASNPSGLADGTYTGYGTSRHGGIGVTLKVSNGKVTSVEISTCGTKYPCSKIASLPGQVLAAQSAKVSYVSGATDSSRAFTSAVAQALAQASA